MPPLRKLTRTFIPNQKEIRYLNKDFGQFRQSLIDFARVYYPDSYNDFNESSPGMLFIEAASYVGDVLSYYIDTQFRENLLQYAQESSNIIAISQALGFKPKPATASFTDLDVYQLCPAQGQSGNYAPDSRYFLILDAGFIASSPQFGVQFRTTDILDFSDPTNRDITVFAVDGLGKPLTYLIKKTVKVVSGTIKVVNQTFGTPTRFSKITLPDPNVLEIVSIVDSNGNTWYEVDYLAQDLIFDKSRNTRAALMTEGIAPYYLLKVKRTPRRFVTRYNTNFFLEIDFGSGVIDDSSNSINLEPNKVANTEYQTNLASTALDPSDFLSSNSYGLSPSNIQLTITYTVGGGIESNVPANAITKIDAVNILNDPSGFLPTEISLFNNIKTSLVVNNSAGALGGKGADSIEEIRQSALAFFNAQNRLVTPDDYVARTFAMPPKFGGVAKAFVARDEQINDILRASDQFTPQGGDFVRDVVSPNTVNLYILGFDQNNNLTILNADTKNNLRNYLDNYRILTDEIHILDAFVINIGVKFNIVVYKNFNMNEVLARAIDAVNAFFDIDKWDINQPIVINDLLLEIAQVEGVQNVTDLEIFNRYKFQDGSDYNSYLYDVSAATENGIIYPSLDPSIFELRHPERDIIGSASQ